MRIVDSVQGLGRCIRRTMDAFITGTFTQTWLVVRQPDAEAALFCLQLENISMPLYPEYITWRSKYQALSAVSENLLRN